LQVIRSKTRLIASTTHLKLGESFRRLLRPKLSKNHHKTSTSCSDKFVCAGIQNGLRSGRLSLKSQPQDGRLLIRSPRIDPRQDNGGSGRTRTTDLTLIRGAL